MDAKTNSSTEGTIQYSREDHDYSAYLGGQYVGSFATYHEAEVELNRLALAALQFAAGWDAASELARAA